MRENTMSYKTLYEELWETEGEKGYTRIQRIFGEKVRKDKGLVLRQSLTKENKKYDAVVIFPSYRGLKAMIDGLVDIYSKEEVERELGIKIGGDKNGV